MGRDIVVRVLGPVRLRAADGWQVPASPQLRLVLGLMALRIGQVVPVAELDRRHLGGRAAPVGAGQPAGPDDPAAAAAQAASWCFADPLRRRVPARIRPGPGRRGALPVAGPRGPRGGRGRRHPAVRCRAGALERPGAGRRTGHRAGHGDPARARRGTPLHAAGPPGVHARLRPGTGGGRRAARGAGPSSAERAPGRDADGYLVPVGPAGRGARRVPADPRPSRGRTGRRARGRAPAPASAHPRR